MLNYFGYTIFENNIILRTYYDFVLYRGDLLGLLS